MMVVLEAVIANIETEQPAVMVMMMVLASTGPAWWVIDVIHLGPCQGLALRLLSQLGISPCRCDAGGCQLLVSKHQVGVIT